MKTVQHRIHEATDRSIMSSRCSDPRRRALAAVPADVGRGTIADRDRTGAAVTGFHNHPNREVLMSRTIKFAKAGGPDVLEFLKTEVPAPGPTEVRIKVKAIGINRAES